MAGAADGPVVQGSLEIARTHSLPYEVLSPKEVTSRFPAFRLRQGELGVYEETSGVLRPEAAIGAFISGAKALGASVYPDTPVPGRSPEGERVRGETGSVDFLCERVLLSTGAWMPKWLQGVPMRVERQVMHWFLPPSEDFRPPRRPLFLVTRGRTTVYGMPDLGEGFKAAFHHGGQAARADGLDRIIRLEDRERITAAVGSIFPTPAGVEPVESIACMYTNTPDEHFIIGERPGHPGVVVAGGFSGHGFKFAAAVGEGLVATMAGHASPLDLSLFTPERFH